MTADAFKREKITKIVLGHTADIREAKMKQENISAFLLA
jgi:hypothetical protein